MGPENQPLCLELTPSQRTSLSLLNPALGPGFMLPDLRAFMPIRASEYVSGQKKLTIPDGGVGEFATQHRWRGELARRPKCWGDRTFRRGGAPLRHAATVPAAPRGRAPRRRAPRPATPRPTTPKSGMVRKK